MARLRRWGDLVRRIETASTGFESLRRMMEYVMQVASDGSVDDLCQALVEVTPPEVHDMAQTLADRLRAEGLAKGHAEGEERALRVTLLDILTVRFGETPPAILHRIRTAAAPELRAWIRASLTAEDVASAFAA